MPTSRQTIDGDVQITGVLEALGGIKNGGMSKISTELERSMVDVQFVQGDVTDILADLSDLESDSKLTPSEKLVVQRHWDIIEADHPKVVEFAAVYGFEAGNVYYDTLITKYTALDDYLNDDPDPLSNLTTTTTIVGGTLRQVFKEYYEAREDLFQAIATGEVMHAPSDEDLVFHISMDDDVGGTGDTIRDSSGNGKVGTIAGSPTWAAGINGTCLTFAGTDQAVTLPSLSALTTFSVCAWVNLDTLAPTDNYPRIVELRESSGNDRIQLQFRNGTNKIEFNCNVSSTEYKIFADDAAVADTWYFVVVTYDGSTLRMYVDGVLQSTTDSLVGASWTPNENSIGSQGDSTTANNFEGEIDEVRVFDIVLTQENVNFLYKVPGGSTQSVMTTSRIANLAITAEKIALSVIDSTHLATDNVDDYFIDVGIAPPDSALVGYWPLNGSPDDYSGNGYDGVLAAGGGGY